MLSKRLRAGDKVGIVSPSNPVTPDLDRLFQNGIAFLRRMELEVVVGKSVHSTTLGYAASPQEKAEDINRMFADKTINAIICSMGGSTANACLSYLDWNTIKDSPKIFCGLSDITVLLNAIYAQTGLITFHGNELLYGLGRNPTAYDEQEFTGRLMQARIGTISANGARKTVRSGVARGRLLGGNLSCLMKLAGTEYLPEFDGAILVLEALSTRSDECDYIFHQLEHMGILSKISGVLIGHVDGLQKTPDLPQMEDVLLRISSDYEFPILKCEDFGHNCPNTVLPVGGELAMDSDAQTVEIVSPFME
jgi:muramoyltetrapeptide carboxypeptidase